MLTYMDDQKQDISNDAVQLSWWLEHNISSHQFAPLSLTVTAYQMITTAEHVASLLEELTEHGYLRHMESEMKTSGLRFEQDNPDLQHYQLGDKVPGRNWGNTPKSHFE